MEVCVLECAFLEYRECCFLVSSLYGTTKLVSRKAAYWIVMSRVDPQVVLL